VSETEKGLFFTLALRNRFLTLLSSPLSSYVVVSRTKGGGGSGVSGVGPGPDAFGSTLHNEVLGRAPEPAGLHYWSELLAKGVKPKTDAMGSRDPRSIGA
jgi:Domain of unknown function (DUF4214)